MPRRHAPTERAIEPLESRIVLSADTLLSAYSDVVYDVNAEGDLIATEVLDPTPLRRVPGPAFDGFLEQNLTDLTGAPAPTSEPEALENGVAFNSEEGLIFLLRDRNVQADAWAAYNVTEVIADRDGIDPSELTITSEIVAVLEWTGLDVGLVDEQPSFIGGYNAGNEFVLYRFGPIFDDGSLADPALTGFVNITTDHLAPAGLDTPVLERMVSYTTAWRGVNVAGLDADGDVHAFWTAPALDGDWTVTNLSDISGAPAYEGRVAAYVTAWGGINIVGASAETGDLVASWWAPALGGEWRVSNMTELTGGPRLEPGSISAYTAGRFSLHVLGLDASGDLQTYWWSPALLETDNPGWRVANLSEVAEIDESFVGAIDTGFQSFYEGPPGQYRYTIFGENAEQEIVRLVWTLRDGWIADNMTEQARIA